MILSSRVVLFPAEIWCFAPAGHTVTELAFHCGNIIDNFWGGFLLPVCVCQGFTLRFGSMSARTQHLPFPFCSGRSDGRRQVLSKRLSQCLNFKVSRLLQLASYSSSSTHLAVWRNAARRWGGNMHRTCMCEMPGVFSVFPLGRSRLTHLPLVSLQRSVQPSTCFPPVSVQRDFGVSPLFYCCWSFFL